jgi:hypothetical protein
MVGISSLWRVAGSLPVPPAADDEGLLSRIADIFAQHGGTVIDERHDSLKLCFGGRMAGRLASRFPWLFDRMEVSRYGIKGWRTLNYNRIAPQLLAIEAVFGGTMIAGHLADWGGLTIALPATVLICLAWYAYTWWHLRKATIELLRRAFET